MLNWRWLLLLFVWMATPVSAELLRLGTYEGIDEELEQEIIMLRQVATQLGYEIELVKLPAQRSLTMAARGDIDGELMRQPNATERFTTLLPLLVPLYRLEYWVMVGEHRDCPASEREVRFLKPVGVLGLKYSERVYRLSEVGFEQAINTHAALRMLLAGRADYIVLPQSRLLLAATKKFGLVLKPCLRRPLLSLDAFVYLHEKHQALVPEFERLLRLRLASGVEN